MYTNSFDSMNIPLLFKSVQRGPVAFWNNTLDFISDFPKPKNISNIQVQLTVITSSTNVPSMSTSPLPPNVQIIQQNVSSPWKPSIRELSKNQTKPLLVLFTSWTDNEEKYLVHNLTTLNWLSLRPFVMPIIFTNQKVLAKMCEGAGFVVLPLRVTAADGVPVLKYMYIDAMRKFKSNFYAYANSDILFTDTLVDTLIEILQNNLTSQNFIQDNSTSDYDNSTSHISTQDNSTSHQDNSTSHHDNSTSHNSTQDNSISRDSTQDNSTSRDSTQDNSTWQHHTLIIGKRTNVFNITMEEGSSWSGITAVAKKRGELFRSDAEDYFITSPSYPWNDMPEVVIGRVAYDNWLVLNARKQKHQVIDATDTLLAVHQTTKNGNFEGSGKPNRDYNHNLLVSLYKSLQYNVGITECAEYKTAINTETFMITYRNLPKYCDIR
ncbi:hypothetical protein ACJMK2_010631 [Sinanodonta woodiana]|uniref:Uncharacterized protein n=1 Tax=Sinanodonta woodiana TaxID=1069815 RepID=A0ABD3VIX3_SINWO